MKRKLYALLLEDIQKDVELLTELMEDAGFDLTIDVVEEKDDFISHIQKNKYDIIFADFTLPRFTGDTALDLAKKICPDVPFICISGTIGEEKAVELLKQGATDYVLKDRMERLAFATRRALDAVAHLKQFRKTEIELQTNRRLLQTIINNALDAIYIKDIHGKYLLFNDAAEKAFGKKSEDVIGKDDSFIFPEYELKRLKDIDDKIINSGIPITYEDSFEIIHGYTRTFHTIKCPMFDESGNASGLFGIARDITDWKALEKKLTDAKNKAEENDRLKTAFLHNISHEIRTPMNAIIGFAGFLKEPEMDFKTQSHYVDIINASSFQLLSIITDIVSISSLETGQEKPVLSDFNLNEVLQTIFYQFEVRAKEKKLGFNFNYPLENSKAEIKSDKTKLIEIITNLLENAFKFTHNGEINFSYRLKDQYLEFVVKDSGIGIPENMYELIFDRFCQVESTLAREYGGTGLGLSISKGYIELLGGKIWVESVQGKGSSFYFTIPYISSEKNKLVVPNISAMDFNRSKTILVAEDEELNFLFLEEVLKRNFKIIHAINGKEAINICQTNEVDLVLMDLKMPIMDGFEATKQIREVLPNLPIIAQTAYTNNFDKEKAINSGCNDFISKPYNKKELERIIFQFMKE
jgi:PAS domain S-box-containing protein